MLERVLNEFETKLPEGITFYKIDNQAVFPIRNSDGSSIEEYICYLVKPPAKYGIEFDLNDDDFSSKLKLENGLVEFLKKLEG